jgi:hypothetical protein
MGRGPQPSEPPGRGLVRVGRMKPDGRTVVVGTVDGGVVGEVIVGAVGVVV